jgi:pilus assembly protein Flp/PilA
MLNGPTANSNSDNSNDFTENRERGASLVEYSLVVALIAVACITAVSTLGTTISDKFTAISTDIGG